MREVLPLVSRGSIALREHTHARHNDVIMYLVEEHSERVGWGGQCFNLEEKSFISKVLVSRKDRNITLEVEAWGWQRTSNHFF
jgi:hypothetical protein